MKTALALVVTAVLGLTGWYMLGASGDLTTEQYSLEGDGLFMSQGRAFIYRKNSAGRKVFCAEPFSDFGINATRTHASKIGGDGPGLDQSAKQAQEIQKLYDRSHSIQLLRDILYRTCEAYANELLREDDFRRLFRQTVALSTFLLGTERISDVNEHNKGFAKDITAILRQVASRGLAADAAEAGSDPREDIREIIQGSIVQ